MESTPFAEALDAVSKPLAFAASDDFAHLARLRDLEGTVRAAAERGAALALPETLRSVFRGIAGRFAEALPEDARRRAVEAALEDLAPLRNADLADQLVATPLREIRAVGAKRADRLARRGLARVVDLLFHLPSRYDDRRALVPVGRLQVGRRATFVADVLAADFVPLRGRGRARRLYQAIAGDDTGRIILKWFRGGDAVKGAVRKGARLLVTGDVRRYRFDREIIHPEVDVLAEGTEPGSVGERIVPDYTVPEGIPPRTFRRLVAHAVSHYADLVPSTLPERLARERGLPPTPDALRAIHDPGEGADLEALRERRTPAHERLVLEELYLLEVGLALRRAARGREPGVPIAADGPRLRAVLEALPFRLTRAQERAWREIREDLARPHPMTRLLQGDVGSGKTAVAALAAAAVAEAGRQAALMAPTELLAEQHERTLRRLLRGATWLEIALLTASLPRAESEARRRAVARGEVQLVVGTHALLQPDLAFADLALVVVDEQHRFGVLQRASLAGKTRGGVSPHALVMTATPIPRSLALTVYGDLDLSVIDALPPGRQAVRTLLLREGEGARILELMRETIDRGEQAYVVYPLVEESEKVDLRAATASFERIRRAFPDAPVDLVHGRLDAAERQAVMERFGRGETRILVSTTVIEVGVDVAAATLMVVEHAERFGLAQLHQLRGRVGRGSAPGTCVLVARGSTEESEARLRAMLETTDGFRIADADLRIRGPGEFLGTRQHGRLPDLRFADLIRDARLVSVAREAAQETVRRDPELRRHAALARAVATRWGERLALVGVG